MSESLLDVIIVRTDEVEPGSEESLGSQLRRHRYPDQTSSGHTGAVSETHLSHVLPYYPLLHTSTFHTPSFTTDS